ncbi:MAG TPA: dTDP-4-dehydrorhamnose 3,5-epimerase [Candidatus Limnocylindria bacterium]
MRVIATELSGVVLLEPAVHGDHRGFLVETFRSDQLAATGVPTDFVQENQSRSRRGTLRGMHFQVGRGQAKLVRVSQGAVLDVVVDIRRGSPTFGGHQAVELDDVRHRQLYVPVGFAHGFYVTSDTADVVYKLDAPYDPSAERGIAWDDPALGIAWPNRQPLLSERDRAQPRLADIAAELPDW